MVPSNRLAAGVVWFAAAAAAWLAGAAVLPCRAAGEASAPRASLVLLVPAYFYPGGAGRRDWERMTAAAQKVPIVAIANPASGPGDNPDANYVRAIRAADQAGVRVIGYISTSYGRRPVDDVAADIEKWKRFYPQIAGIFLDEQSSAASDLGHYQRLVRSARRAIDDALVVSNPGTMCAGVYFEGKGPDVVCVFERGKPLTAFQPPPWTEVYSPDRFAALSHSRKTAAAADQIVQQARRRRVRYLYATDDAPPNPWDRLPSFWNELVASVQRANH